MQYLLPFILAMVVTMAWLPVLVRLGNKWLFVDQPGERKVHSIPIPRVGGIAMACGVLVAALVTINLQPQDYWFLLAAMVVIIFGAIDDRFDLDYRIKLLGQLIAVNIVVLLGSVQIHTLSFDDQVALPGWVSMPLTVFFLVGVTNAINLADGLDGLAGGTTFLCLCAVALLSSVGDPGNSTALTLAFAGAVLGFLRFNTYPASVFMGDAGSQLLGFTIGVLSVRATQGASSMVSAALPVLLLALPILDTLSVMAQRIGEGRSPFSADKNHIHHKLLALGFDHHEAVMVIYAVQAALFVMAYFLRYESDLVILGVVSLFFAMAISAFQIATRTGWRLRNGRKDAVSAPLPRLFAFLERPKTLQRWSYVALAVALALYAALIIFETAALNRDIRILILALLAVACGFLLVLRSAPLNIVEKAALFVSATMLVYLDALVLPPNPMLAALGWVAVIVVAIASAVRLRLFNDRRFELTPLDLIVLFMALVVPSMLGSFRLPHGGALAIAKLVILLYGIEMLVTRAESRAVWVRIGAAAMLAGLMMRSTLSL
ncbi:MAG: glycosyltransferase family 4 protein [Steroidobacteraceae bacterium]|jgi:UDP-GlcNAc:undecaprenyl-phosphate GlcNAc-1-phosphate transferase